MTGVIALGVHVAAGTAALAVGPIAIRTAASSGPHRAGDVYHCLVAVVCLSAVALAVIDWSRLWFFVPIAVGSYAFAGVGHLAGRRRRRNARKALVRGYGGAYIALVTALFVVSFGALPMLWFLPTALGVPALHWLGHHTADAATASPTAAVEHR